MVKILCASPVEGMASFFFFVHLFLLVRAWLLSLVGELKIPHAVQPKNKVQLWKVILP